MRTIYYKNEKYPSDELKAFTTAVDNQTSMLIQVYEGDSDVTKNNRLLGSFLHEGIEPQFKGEARVLVRFEIDQDSILTVSAGKAGGKNDWGLPDIEGPATTKTMLTKNPQAFDKFYHEKLDQQEIEKNLSTKMLNLDVVSAP